MAEAIDFSQTQRVVLLIDLNPIRHLQNPNSYINSILTSTQTLLTSFPSLSSSSLFAFKLFFSSLSPLLSSFKLPTKSSLSLSFDSPSNTLLSLSKTLKSIPTLVDKSGSSSPRASLVASSLRQILHDYAWDYQNGESTGMLNCTPVVRSNLVILFSPFFKELKWLAEYMDVGLNDELLINGDVFREKFRLVFDSVNDAFVSRDIHLSWVDVKFELECTEEKVEIDESELRLGFLERGIKSLGWGFCSTDTIVLGSALVPFGLIYPMIAVSSNCLNYNARCKKLHAQLNLQISDVSGKPLECKGCDLDLIDLKMLTGNRSDDILQGMEFINSHTGAEDRRKTFWGQFGEGITNFNIKAVQRYDESVKIEGHLSDIFLVHEFSGLSGNDRKENSEEEEHFAYRVLKMLRMRKGEFMQRKSVPIWQILLNFLYSEGYWAVVSVSNGNGDSCMGILKPFTVHSALLFIMDNKLYPHNMVHDIGGQNLSWLGRKIVDEIGKSNINRNNSNGCLDLQTGMIPTRKDVVAEDGKRKKNKWNSHLYRDLTWSSFYKAAFEQSKMDLGGIYFAWEGKSSKKLKFLKCWMKQIKKSSCCNVVVPDRSKPHQDTPKETEDRLRESQQENELAVSSSASAGEDALTGASKVQDEVALDFYSGTFEDFFCSLSKKIQDGLESGGVDLGALAERLVRTAIYWLYQKHESSTSVESQTNMINPDDTFGCIIANELMKHLLKEPKELSVKHNKNDSSLQASDPRSTGFTSEIIVREYELQILFRMEILQSEIATSIEESRKQKFVKHICLLLEKIQCHMEGGFFGDWSLDNYVGKIIKNRYSHSVNDVVDKIYQKMDLLLFGDEEESPNPLLNSEDSNQSWKDKLERDDGMGENTRVHESVSADVHESVSADDESLQPLKDDNPQRIKREEHERKLLEAQKRRERARRFASFTRVPDLHRVWAPKQLKIMKANSDSSQISKRKKHRRTSFDTVCETPMTGNKRQCHQESSPGGSNSCKSVSKALFQDTR